MTHTLLWPLGLCDTDNLEEGLRGNLCYIVPLSQIILIHVYCASFLHLLCLIPKHSCMYTYCVSFPNISACTRTVSHSQAFLHVHVLCLIPKHSCMYTFSVYCASFLHVLCLIPKHSHSVCTFTSSSCGVEGDQTWYTHTYTLMLNPTDYRCTCGKGCVCLHVSSTAGGVPG